MTKIIFSLHSLEKIKILNNHGFNVIKKDIINTVKNPNQIIEGYRGVKIAQKILNDEHLLRVIYKEEKGLKKIITVYPGRRDRYENKVQ